MSVARKIENSPQLKRVVGYVRVSTEEQAENPEGSIRNQEERIRQTVRFKNMEGTFGELTHVFVERGKSGKNTKRPELQRLLSMIRRREVDLIIVTELSRLSRSIKDFAEMWELMQAHGCAFMSLRENFDTTTAAGEMVLFTLASIAQFERKQVSERVKAGFATRAARGLFNGGRVPIGYKLDPERPGHFIFDEEMANVVRHAFPAYLMKESLSEAAKWLNEAGHRVKRVIPGGGGGPRIGAFTVDNLYILLSNKAYIGIRTYTDLKGQKHEVKAAWPALIPEQQFLDVQKLLERNRSVLKPKSMMNRFPYLLSGLTECGTCRDKLPGKSAHGHGGKIAYYEHSWASKRASTLAKETLRCEPHRILARRLEPLVWGMVRDLLTQPEYMTAVVEEAHAIHRQRLASPERDRLKKRLSGIKSQMEILAERLSTIPAGVPTGPIFGQMKKLDESREETEAQLAEVEGGREGVMELPAELKDYESLLAAIHGIEAMDPEQPEQRELCRKIIHRLVYKIEVLPDHARVHLYAGREYVQNQAKSEEAALLGNEKSDSCELFGPHGSRTLTFGA
ncbi:MAG: recombinase family protein, partial [Bdellovibrionales bacterium]|nr:recombinase family protein [Bdellovibrionales bacterium]